MLELNPNLQGSFLDQGLPELGPRNHHSYDPTKSPDVAELLIWLYQWKFNMNPIDQDEEECD